MKNKQTFSIILLILTAMIWGASYVFQLMGADQVPTFTFCGARMTLAAGAVGLVVFIMERREIAVSGTAPARSEQYRKNTFLGGLCCGCALAAALIFQQAGVAFTTAGKAGFITALYIILVPIFGKIFLHHKTTTLTWLAVFVGVAGMYFLCLTESFTLSKGDFLIFVSSLFYGMHLLFCDYFAPRGDAVRISVLQFIVTAVISWILAFIIEDPSWQQLTAAAIPVLYCGFLSGGAGYTLQIVAQKHVEPVKATLILCSESVFAVIFGVLLLGESMSPRELLGCAMMMTAIVLIQLPQKEKCPS